MLKTGYDPTGPAKGGGGDPEIVELPLLLPRWQIQALETAARRQGITTGQMIRRVISQQLSSVAQSAS